MSNTDSTFNASKMTDRNTNINWADTEDDFSNIPLPTFNDLRSNMRKEASRSVSFTLFRTQKDVDEETFPVEGLMEFTGNDTILEKKLTPKAWTAGSLPSFLKKDTESKQSNDESSEVEVPEPLDLSTFVKKMNEQSINQETNTDKYITPNIRLANTVDNLKLYHYANCDETDTEDVRNSRGIIRDGDTIVCKTFGFTPEIDVADMDKVHSMIHSFNQCKIYDSQEGATLRLFFYDNQWYLATHRKIDAYHSRWGSSKSSSFGDMFIDALILLLDDKKDSLSRSEMFDYFCDRLDRSRTYTFLVRNSAENRIVCDAPRNPTMYFIGAFDNSTHLLVESDGSETGVPMPNQHKFDSIEDTIKHVELVDCRQTQGVIVYLPNQQQVKIMNSNYVNYFQSRGNEPSIKFRYLQVRHDKDMVEKLYNLYPEFISHFEKYEKILKDVARRIHNAYIQRYIKHEFVSLPQPEYYVSQACHNWHKKDSLTNKITYDKVVDILNSQSATSLNKIIKLYIHSQN
jgi:hypothetical protein